MVKTEIYHNFLHSSNFVSANPGLDSSLFNFYLFFLYVQYTHRGDVSSTFFFACSWNLEVMFARTETNACPSFSVSPGVIRVGWRTTIKVKYWPSWRRTCGRNLICRRVKQRSSFAQLRITNCCLTCRLLNSSNWTKYPQPKVRSTWPSLFHSLSTNVSPWPQNRVINNSAMRCYKLCTTFNNSFDDFFFFMGNYVWTLYLHFQKEIYKA